MIVLLSSISALLMQYAHTIGRELSCYKLTNYLIADHTFPRALLEEKIDQFIDDLLVDILRRLCMDKRKRPSLRDSVRMNNNYYNNLQMNNLHANVA